MMEDAKLKPPTSYKEVEDAVLNPQKSYEELVEALKGTTTQQPTATVLRQWKRTLVDAAQVMAAMMRQRSPIEPETRDIVQHFASFDFNVLHNTLEKVKFLVPEWGPPHYTPRKDYWDELAQPMAEVPGHCDPWNYAFFFSFPE